MAFSEETDLRRAGLGQSLFSGWGSTTIENGGPGVLALGAVLLCYGLVELAESYGFIGAFTAGLCVGMSRESIIFTNGCMPLARLWNTRLNELFET